MSEEFKLDKNLENDGEVIAELALCKVILVNNSNFPWVILVPKHNKLKEIIDLNKEDQILLMNEISYISTIMQELFQPDKLNVAALGNIVSQLHIHIIARFKNDIVWPEPVFGKDKNKYSDKKYSAIIKKIKEKLKEKN